jgi:hypothetical protein
LFTSHVKLSFKGFAPVCRGMFACRIYASCKIHNSLEFFVSWVFPRVGAL